MRIANRFQLLICAAGALVSPANQIEVLIPAKPKIQSEFPGYFPIILEIEPEHFGAVVQKEMGIARSVRHPAHRTRCRETLWVKGGIGCDHARNIKEVDFERGVELEEAPEFWLPDIVETRFQAVMALDN